MKGGCWGATGSSQRVGGAKGNLTKKGVPITRPMVSIPRPQLGVGGGGEKGIHGREGGLRGLGGGRFVLEQMLGTNI